jgi:hypothetical protein
VAEAGDGVVGFHADVRLRGALVLVFADMVALLEGFVDIAPFDMAVDINIQLNAVVDLGRLFFNGFQGVKDGG